MIVRTEDAAVIMLGKIGFAMPNITMTNGTSPKMHRKNWKNTYSLLLCFWVSIIILTARIKHRKMIGIPHDTAHETFVKVSYSPDKAFVFKSSRGIAMACAKSFNPVCTRVLNVRSPKIQA
jgi:hypothetical protein